MRPRTHPHLHRLKFRLLFSREKFLDLGIRCVDLSADLWLESAEDRVDALMTRFDDARHRLTLFG